ncbi:tetratricopeptide repeat protein, partial [Streptomyces sp. NPDC018031]|uniref:tetratricopeptide repeat protein n=1 Tax=Streptomyces sp. NPDC018031 TaxID=3365033 RepID=UPI003799CB9F
LWRGKAGDVAGAAAAYADLLAAQEQVLGEDHPATLTTRNNLAMTRGRGGDVAGAADAFADLLADRVRVLGEDHPATLATRNNLAHWRGKAGDVAGAAAAYADLLAAQEQVLGEDHPDTLTTRNNLAHWRKEAVSAPETPGAETAISRHRRNRADRAPGGHPAGEDESAARAEQGPRETDAGA